MLTHLPAVTHLSGRMGSRILDFAPMTVPETAPEIDAEMQKKLAGLAPQLSQTKTIITSPGIFRDTTATVPMTKADLFQEFPKKAQEVKEMHTNLCEWFGEVIRANTVHRHVKKSPRNVQPTTAQPTTRSVGKGLPIHVELPILSMAELAVKPIAEIRQCLNDYLHQATMDVVKALLSGLQALLDAQQVGQLQWISSTVCKFYFYRNIVEEEVLGERSLGGQLVTERRDSNQITRTAQQLKERDVRRTWKHALHYHELMESRRLPWNDQTLPKPRRVQVMLSRAPAFLAHFGEIVVGDEIFRRVVERELQSESVTEQFVDVKRFVYSRDPAVVVGPYVISGWAAEEVRS